MPEATACQFSCPSRVQAVVIAWLAKAKLELSAKNVRAVITKVLAGHAWYPKTGKAKNTVFVWCEPCPARRRASTNWAPRRPVLTDRLSRMSRSKVEHPGILALKWLAESTLNGQQKAKMLALAGLASATIDPDILNSLRRSGLGLGLWFGVRWCVCVCVRVWCAVACGCASAGDKKRKLYLMLDV